LWFNNSPEVLGFAPIEADWCVFVYPEDSHIIIVCVDDLLLIAKDKKDMAGLEEKLFHRYKSRDVEPVCFYLGVGIMRDRTNRSISLAIDGYFDRLAEEYHFNNTS
jgi:hypothetical protein